MLLSKIWTSDGLPLDLEEVKLALRVDSSDEDGVVTRMIRAAADFAEERTGQVFAAGSYHVLFDDWGCCFPCKDGFRREIFRGPLREVTGVSYLSANGVYTATDLASFLISNRGKSFTITPLTDFDAPDLFMSNDGVRLEFDSGFDPADGDSNLSGEVIPLGGGLKHMLTMLVGHYYKNRELFEADKMGDLTLGAGSILGAYRQFW